MNIHPLLPIIVSTVGLIVSLLAYARTARYKNLELKSSLVSQSMAFQAELLSSELAQDDLNELINKINGECVRLGIEERVTPQNHREVLAEAGKWAEKLTDLAHLSEGRHAYSAYRSFYDKTIHLTEKTKLSRLRTEKAIAEAEDLHKKLLGR